MGTAMLRIPMRQFSLEWLKNGPFWLASGLFAVVVTVAGCGKEANSNPQPDTATSTGSATRKGPGTWGDLWKDTPIAAGKSELPIVRIVTSEGTITLELNRRKAPATVENFIAYAKSGFYDGTRVHRAERGVRLDAGRFDGKGNELATRAPIRSESDNGLSNVRGTIAMARRAEPHSATSAFFFNLSDQSTLDYRGRTRPEDWGNCVFGRVKDADGLAVLDRLAASEVAHDPITGRATAPKVPIVITSVEVVTE